MIFQSTSRKMDSSLQQGVLLLALLLCLLAKRRPGP